jgi:nucleoside-diphosphate-sugar epimerase
MKAIITGGSGFLGKHLIKYLEQQEVEVILLKHQQFYTEAALQQFFHSHKPDYIFLCHAYGNMSNQKGDMEVFMANLYFTFLILRVTCDISYKAFINVSTSSVNLSHQTMYSATKAGAEALCKAYVDEYDKPIVTLRPYSVYGEGEASFRFIPTLFRSAVEGKPMTLDPKPVHDWIYVGDFVKTMWKSAQEVDKFKGKTLEVGTGTGVTNQKVLQLVEEITGKEIAVTDTKTLRKYDNTSWVAPYSDPSYIDLRTGLQKYFEWYTQQTKGGDN